MLELAKEYLRIDGTEEDSFLGFLIESAEEYLTNAGVKQNESKTYELAVMMLVTHWYENRDQIVKGDTTTIDLGLQSIILQLKVGGST